jgi:hypothetical protein
MASSLSALAASLENVARRLRRLESGQPVDDMAIENQLDLEEEDDDEAQPEETRPPTDRLALAAELARVEAFVARARALPNDAKARSFKEAIGLVARAGTRGAR